MRFRFLRIYWHCPEIRQEMRNQLLSKLVLWMSVLILSPLIVLGILSELLLYFFEKAGSIILWLPWEVVNYLNGYAIEQTRVAHAKLPSMQIQERIGTGPVNLLPKDDELEDL